MTRILRNLLYLAATTAALLATSACSHDDKGSVSGAGYIKPEVSVPGNDGIVASQMELTLQGADGKTYTWDSPDDFDVEQGFAVGHYILSASYGSEDREGKNAPYYFGQTSFVVTSGVLTPVEVPCSRRNVAVWLRIDPILRDGLSECEVTVHATTGSYFPLSEGDTEPVYIKSGNCDVLLSFTLKDGRKAAVLAASFQTSQGEDINLTVSGDGDAITVSTGQRTERVELTEDLFATPAPLIDCQGFTAGEPLVVAEGTMPGESVKMIVTGCVPLTSIYLTVQSPSLLEAGLHPEIDLLNATDEQKLTISKAGFNIQQTTDLKTVTVDLTNVIPHLRYSPQTDAPQFSLMAFDALDQVSAPMSLRVDVELLELQLKSLPPVMVGAENGSAEIVSPSAGFHTRTKVELSQDGTSWTETPITGCTALGGDLYRMEFALPKSTASRTLVRMSYIGNLFAESELNFYAPEYTLSVDPYAHHAIVRVNPKEEVMRGFITDNARIFINGLPGNVYSRDKEKGYLFVTGLPQESEMTFTSTLFSNPGADSFTPAVTVRTEGTPTLPNSDFEEIKETIKYNHLPQGGFYSQTEMPLYNRQNSQDVTVNEPKSPWCSVNAKTFYKASTNPNSWYMQPSTYESSDIISGAVSVRLVSVAFDPAGEPIPPYRQTGQPYLDYNPSIPNIRYKAAGKLFLGNYAYTPEGGEAYAEGIDFQGRPSSLNGLYRYFPGAGASDDTGLARISLLGYVDGQLTVIGHGEQKLYPCMIAANFSVPITYDYFGVPAVRLCVMIASSSEVGSIEYETAHVPVSPNPIIAASTGSVLEVDHLSLSY